MTAVCQCTVPDDVGELFCERHQCVKSPRLVELCNMGARGERTGLRYWNAWEAGKGPRRPGPTVPPAARNGRLGEQVVRALADVDLDMKWIAQAISLAPCWKRQQLRRHLEQWAKKQQSGKFSDKDSALNALEELLE